MKIVLFICSIYKAKPGIGGHYYSLIETAKRLAEEHEVIVLNIGSKKARALIDCSQKKNFVIEKQQSFVDHHSFTLADFTAFDDNIPLLMTEKDAVKCRDFCKDNWWYLPVDATFTLAEQQVLQDKIKAAI